MDCKLSILIPTLPTRRHFYERLHGLLTEQINAHPQGNQIEIVTNDTGKEICIGTKRNLLMAAANGEYMAFFDDDDRPGPNYIARLMEGIAQGVDCCSLHGIITTDGRNPKHFYHSIQYDRMFEQDKVYYRPVMHINCIKTELARQCVFPEWKYSEDSNFAFQLQHKGLLKKEHVIDEVIYYYDFIQSKNY
ncbi:MAG: glycosyltransferase family A protein [Bacteroidota bacterium]